MSNKEKQALPENPNLAEPGKGAPEIIIVQYKQHKLPQ